MIVPPRRRAVWAIAISAIVLIGGACSSSSSSSSKDKATTDRHASSTVPPSTGTTVPGLSPTPRATPAEAVQVLLTAEKRNDHTASFRVLSSQGRDSYPDVSKWGKRRSELPAVTSFTVKRTDGGGKSGRATVIVDVRHQPKLDPFIGLSAARENETWTVRKQGSGWLADADPSIAYDLPSNAVAATAAASWARAVQACDAKTGGSLQAVPELYGESTAAAKLCRSKGTVSAGKVDRLEAGPSSSDLIAQYSTDALAWARTVRLKAPSGAFTVVMAPIGGTWKVVGLAD